MTHYGDSCYVYKSLESEFRIVFIYNVVAYSGSAGETKQNYATLHSFHLVAKKYECRQYVLKLGMHRVELLGVLELFSKLDFSHPELRFCSDEA